MAIIDTNTVSLDVESLEAHCIPRRPDRSVTQGRGLLAVSGDIRLERLVTRVFPVADYGAAFALVRDRAAGAIKVIVEWSAHPVPSQAVE